MMDKLSLDEFIKKIRDPVYLSIPRAFRYVEHQQWREYLHDKRIALIGPACDTINHRRGKWLKQFDCIARCNRSIPIASTLYPFICDRTDIYYNNLNQDNGKNIIIPRVLDFSGVKIIVGSYPIAGEFISDYRRFVTRRESGNIPHRTIPVEYYLQIKNQIHHARPTSGILAIFDLLQTNCAFLFVCGFSFFSTPHIESYGGVNNTNLRGYSENLHNIEEEKNFIRNLAYKDSRLILDCCIRNILWKTEREWFFQNLDSHDLAIQFPPKIDPFYSIWVFDGSKNIIQLFDTRTNTFTWEFTPRIPHVIPRGIRGDVPGWFPCWWSGFSQVFLYTFIHHRELFANIDKYIPVIWLHSAEHNCNLQFNNIHLWELLKSNHICIWINSIFEYPKIKERYLFFN